MKKQYLFLLLFTISGFSQGFEEIPTTINNFYYATSDVADYDNDGDLDILICGAIDTSGSGSADTSFCQLFKNEDGVYSADQDFSVNSLHLGDVAFIDIDNDGLKDVVITGQNYNDITTFYLYVYKNSGNGFELVQTENGSIYSTIDVIDYNFDGKQDFILNGVDSNGQNAFLFTNTNGQFEAQSLNINGTQNGHIRVADLNNDLQPDVIVMGIDSTFNEVVTVYLNVDGILTQSQSLGNIYNGSFNIADFNADGALDIVLSGSDQAIDYDSSLKVFFNDGLGQFTEVFNVPGVENFSGVNSVEVGDLNNDGYYDFIIAGDADYESVVRSYFYEPDTANFVASETLNGIHPLGAPSDLQLFDFDGDDKLDLLSTGFDSADEDYRSFTKLFKNISDETNVKPEAPVTFEAQLSDNIISFGWSGATDDKTPEAALQYHFRAGTTPNTSDIASYKVTSNKWKLVLENIPTNLYWSVSSIDASKLVSDESAEQHFSTLSAQDFSKSTIRVSPNPAQNYITVQTKADLKETILFNMIGQEVSKGNAKNIDLTAVKAGVYLLKVTKTSGETFIQKIVKK